jgi:hypothetical protein
VEVSAAETGFYQMVSLIIFFSIDNVISPANMARLGESLKQQASPLLAVNIELQPANMGQFYSAKSGKLSQKVMS